MLPHFACGPHIDARKRYRVDIYPRFKFIQVGLLGGGYLPLPLPQSNGGFKQCLQQSKIFRCAATIYGAINFGKPTYITP